jgi:AAA ATPase domain
MDPVRNPFAPGAGLRPPAFVGRARELSAATVALDRLADRRPARGLTFVGVRGVGKTALLNEIRRQATDRGWIVAKIEAARGHPFRASVAQALNSALRSATGRFGLRTLDRSLAVFKSFSLLASPDGALALGIDVDPAGGIANTGDLEIDLTELLGDLGATCLDQRIGLAIIVDELHDVSPSEIAAIAGALHDAHQQGLPVILFGAGLPNLPSALANAKSYAERLVEVRELEPFDDELAAEALTSATTPEGVGWTGDAIRLVIDAARGYPYFLQVYGKFVWDFALSSPITGSDARVGIAAGDRDLERFFGARWDRTTPAQQQYLSALASLDEGSGLVTTRAIAESLGATLGSVSSTRDQLLRKGIVYAPDRGHIAFTTPGMAEFVREASGSGDRRP